MGLSIHYNGAFNALSSMSKLIEEVVTVADVYHWDTKIFHSDFVFSEDYDREEPSLFGVVFVPSECEPVSIVFLPDGKMVCPVRVELMGLDNKYTYYTSVKTQFAGEQVHKVIIHLFKHLQNKGYFSSFEMSDEGQYWETRDKQILHQQFENYNAILDNFAFGLENFPVKDKEGFDNYIKRLFNMVNDHLNQKIMSISLEQEPG